MPFSPLLGPVVALVAWTLVVMAWMFVARGAQFRRLGINLGNIPAGSRGLDLEGRAEASAQWKSHNYNHLMEQPTIFYAIVLALVAMHFDQPINLWLAWGYVGFRVLHSIVQCTVNQVRFRLPLFVLATLCLIGLTTHAAIFLIHHG
ncbi:MAG: MAPEG family protein [Sphingomicrobium sp.]